ncbi:hypothetical protein CcaCcLH18_04428 [Colletotrichum camelliae]|nr:hypothetical protein CcaCcLH18_04428 [Colletotrichum camelliae]
MDISDHGMFTRHLAELAGESRDRSLRPSLEKQAEKLIDELFDDDYDLADDWFDANISLVTNLEKDMGPVFLGKDEAITYFERLQKRRTMEDEKIRLNFVLVSADRGRVTSHVELFSKCFAEDAMSCQAKKEVLLIIMDLNDSNMVQRMEVRLLCIERGKDEDQWLDWNSTIRKIGNKPVVIDYSI